MIGPSTGGRRKEGASRGGTASLALFPKRLGYCLFSVGHWDSGYLIEAILRNDDRHPEELQTELSFKKIWALVPKG